MTTDQLLSVNENYKINVLIHDEHRDEDSRRGMLLAKTAKPKNG